MATKARQQYFADEISLQKDSREFSLEDNVKQKIDSVEVWAQVNTIETVKVNGAALTPDANKAVNVEVPDVIDNLYSTSTDDALSAKQWKVLYDYLQNIASRWRFLSNWNSATGLPTTNPSESPYPYKSWDYFNVSNVAWLWGTNYRPDGSSYIIWQASTVVETEDVSVSDFYFYDGTNWLLLSNSDRQIAIDASLSTTSTNPVENRVITNALNWKHPWEISNVAPSNPIEWMIWYDTTNDKLKTYDWSNWNECWAWWGIEIFPMYQYGWNTDWTDIIDSCANNNTLTILLDVWEDDYATQTWWVKWLVTEYDDWATSWTWRISAIALFNLNWVGSAVPYPKSNKLVVTFNATTKYCTGITQSYTEFVPTNSWSTGNVLTKTANGYEWSAPSGWVKVYDCDDLRSNWVQDLVTEFANGTLCAIQDNNATWASFWHFDQWTMWIVAYAGWWNIKAYNIAQDTNSIRCAKIFEAPYNTSTYVLWTITLTSLSFFAPWGTATTGYVVTKTAGGYEWAAPTEPTVVSDDSWVTYHITVSNSDPTSWTASNIITLVP